MKVHHLNCGVFHLQQFSKILKRQELCCHCLLLEGPDRLALIDTGLPTHYQNILDEMYHSKILGVQKPKEFNSVAQIKKLGFDPKDVRDIFITHLDHDHVGGLADFPQAQVHLHLKEFEFSREVENSIKLKMRFKTHLWKAANFHFYSGDGDSWYGFQSVKNSVAFQDDLVFLPLFGHTPGHTGYAVRQGGGWVFHAGDAYYLKEELNTKIVEQSLAAELMSNMLSLQNGERMKTLQRLRRLNADQAEVQIINSHDDSYLPRRG